LQGRFGALTSQLIGDNKALNFFSYSRNNLNTNQYDVFLTTSLSVDQDADLQYVVCLLQNYFGL